MKKTQTLTTIGMLVAVMMSAEGAIAAHQNSTPAPGANRTTFTFPAAGAVTRTVEDKLQELVSVKDFGAVGDGVRDDTAAIQAALDAASGSGRSAFSLYFPSVPGGFYKVSDTLVIDDMHGIVIHGDGALTHRGTHNAAIRWYGSESKPVFHVIGQTAKKSHPNFFITFRDLTISGYPSSLPKEGILPANIALSGIHIGTLHGQQEPTVNRRAIVENVHITNCRFGIWAGNADGLNTDHATTLIKGCELYGNAQAGLHWGTGNAIVNLVSCDVFANGWAGDAFAVDAYSAPVGANVHLAAGYLDIVSYTSAGLGDTKPTTADIYQGNGRVSIINAWSDVHGYFFYQAVASPSCETLARHVGQVTGVRHYEGSMKESNTPHSMRIVSPGTFVSGCLVYGNIDVDSGLDGRPVFAGINFIRKNATYIGSGVNTVRSLTVLGNAGDNAQVLLGGADSGVPLSHRGNHVPQILSMGDNPTLFQALDASGGGSAISFHANTKDADQGHQLLMNGFFLPMGILPMDAYAMVWLLELGGSQGWRIKGHDRAGFSSEIPIPLFADFGGLKAPPLSGARSEVTFQPPARHDPPRSQSGDHWIGSMYFDKRTNKLRVNTGGSTWEDLH